MTGFLDVVHDLCHGGGGILIPRVEFAEGIDDDQDGIMVPHELEDDVSRAGLEDVRGIALEFFAEIFRVDDTEVVGVEHLSVLPEGHETIGPRGARGIDLYIKDTPVCHDGKSQEILGISGHGLGELDGETRFSDLRRAVQESLPGDWNQGF